ncbi:hypothetical protein LCGC14_0906150, partial [marine sediment metagenome]
MRREDFKKNFFFWTSDPFLGLNVGIWDMGGQEQYRKDYMENTEPLKGT